MASLPARVPDDEPTTLRWKAGRVAMVVAILAMVVFWAWIFAGGPRKANPDRLRDRAFVQRTADRCDALRTDLRTLPNAAATNNAAARADVLDRANTRVAAFVRAVEADAPRRGDDVKSVRGWLADWRRYLADRGDFSRRLRRDPKAQLRLSQSPLKDGVDQTIEVFADVNDMASCATPGDVG